MRTTVTFLLILSFNIVYGTHSKNPSLNKSDLNTAANVSYLSSFEKEIVFEINKLRSNPAKYANEYIAPLAKHYNRRLLYYPNDKPLMTREGVRALNECVSVLRNTKSMPIMYPNKGLSKAANDHVRDQSKTGKTGHKGGDHSDIKERMERYGDWKVRIAENIAYGGSSARQVVIYLLIDDGIKNRGHRKNFLHPEYKMVGVASGTHPGYRNMCVMDFANLFIED
ncbi:MAG: CAP domain-containing protein [Bacteroidetes bacterium]|nr:CAP domain-containing protein [Bacteroidota bacterium]